MVSITDYSLLSSVIILQCGRSCAASSVTFNDRLKGLFLPATTGTTHPSAKKYRALNDCVARAVAANGRVELLVYLRSVAHLSHS